ncbi:MAG: response regulator [Acidobacteria bacterium]|nr:MAG: response regulator [Acidobacteriota bacterium]
MSTTDHRVISARPTSGHDAAVVSDGSLDLWRRRVLDGLTWILVVVIAGPVLLVVTSWIRVGRVAPALALVAVWAAIAVVAVGRRMQYRLRAWLLLALLIAATQVGIATAGVTSGIGTLLAMTAAFGALLLGLRAALVGLVLQLIGCAVLGLLMVQGALPLPPMELALGHQVAEWARKMAVAGGLSLLIAVAFSLLLEKLTVSLRRAEDLVEELQDQIAVREREASARVVAEERLWQAQKRELLGQMAASLAHEINNTLTVVRANAEFLRRDLEVAPEVTYRDLAAHAREIEVAASAASRETRQLLTLGRHEASEVEITDPCAELRAAEVVIRRLMRDDIEVELRVGERVPSVEVDRRQLRQAILNLAMNARDAMPRGGRLTLSVSSEEIGSGVRRHDGRALPGRCVSLCVEDDGIGIAPELRDRIFEPFFTSKDSSRGSGLGLSFVRSFVERAGGLVLLDSEPGRGSRFRIVLPPAVGAEVRRDPAEDSWVHHLERGSERVLVVDDHDQVRHILEAVLRRAGYQVRSVASGEEALPLLDTEPGFDLLLTDSVMPGMRGEELAEHYLRNCPHGRVVVCSGHVGDPAVQELRERRGFGFLRKPFTPLEVTRSVRRALDRLSAGAAS